MHARPAGRTGLRLCLSLALLAGCSAGGSSPPADRPEQAATGPSPSPANGPSTYLALGDSVAAGVGAPAGAGYVPLLADRLRARLGCDTDPAAAGCPLELRQLSMSGATTAGLLREQLPAAQQALAEGDVRLVTVTVGGNDVVGPALRACAGGPEQPACGAAVEQALADADRGLDAVLAALKQAAGPQVPVVVMAYYDPLAACALSALQPLSAQVLEGTGDRPGLNDAVRARAEQHGALVVETGGLLQVPQDLVGGADCLHPSASGHERLAAAFDERVGELVAAPGG